MSILIKGVDAPNMCRNCWFAFTGPDFYYCHAPGRDGEAYDYDQAESIPEDCPIGEVPTPHGRLIDVETVLHDGDRGCIDELVNDPFVSDEYKVGVKAARVIVCSAPIIIESEE